MKGNPMRHALSLVAMMLFAMTLTGCNTMKGFGKDVERGGERVQDAAQGTQNRM